MKHFAFRIQHAIVYAAAVAMTFFTSCEETTGNLGISSETDIISSTTATFDVTSRSVLMNKDIISNSSTCYLGRITDNESGSIVEAEFAAQFQAFDNYEFPKKEMMVDVSDSTNIRYGIPRCDSCDVRLYFKSYYGDGSNAMKLQVYQLSSEPDKILSEDKVYYTDLDISLFLPDNAKPIASRWFSAIDYNVNEEDRTSSDYNKNVHIVLPRDFGQRILDKYYEDKRNFQDSYHFTHNVMPGLYFRCSDGDGTMLKFYVGALNLFFHYSDGDSIYPAMTRFAATPEVIQSTRFTNANGLEELLADNTCTYLKTPAGIATEMTLPINQIFGGEHSIDSVSKASITLTRYNKPQEGYQFGIPKELVMIRKGDMRDFFLNKQAVNNRTNFVTQFSATYNSYTFTNISRLLSYCHHEKMQAVQARLQQKGLTNYNAQQLAQEEALWEAENPDWNKVLLIPIVTTTDASGGGQVSASHDLDLNSIRLVGGSTPLQMQVVYSRFWQ